MVKSYDPPKCKLCGERHALGAPHTYSAESTITALPLRTGVTSQVTAVTQSVRPVTPVTHYVVVGEHECPVCGDVHAPPSPAAKKQRAYRERLKAKA